MEQDFFALLYQHSRYFSEDTFKKLKGDNKELIIIPGANHTDLYDRMDVIPFDKMAAFFEQYLEMNQSDNASRNVSEAKENAVK